MKATALWSQNEGIVVVPLAEGDKLWSRLAQAPLLGEVTFTLPARPNRPSRPVVLTVRAERVTLSPKGAELLKWYGNRWSIEVFLESSKPVAGWKPCSSAPWNAWNRPWPCI